MARLRRAPLDHDAGPVLPHFSDARFSFRADAGEDRLMKFGITDAAIRMNDAPLAALWGLTAVRLSTYRCHLRHLLRQIPQAR